MQFMMLSRDAGLVSVVLLLAALNLPADEAGPFGMEKRVLWTTSRVVGSPEPPAPYATESAFPKLTFDHPIDLVAAPGSDQLFVAEHMSGHIYRFPNRPDVDRAELFLDLRQEGRELWSLAFHPGFETNRFVYVCYNDKKPKPDRNRLSRFHVDAQLHADSNSEYIVLEWPTGGHNGGCVKFGREGYLYTRVVPVAAAPLFVRRRQRRRTLPPGLRRCDSSPGAGSQNGAAA
jgi:glucose/arabinose dehydrogenase